jgi:UDP-glucose 4-epimerase
MSKYIVTGCAGFIGSHLTEGLLRDGHEVVGVDNLSSGLEKNMEKFSDSPNFKFVYADITSWSQLSKNLFSFRGAIGVFHVAGFSRIQPSIHSPELCMNTNINGTMNVLEMMRVLDIKSIVYSASSSRYGLKNVSPLKENMVCDCLNPYSVSKYSAELLCQTWGKIYGINNVSLIYFNVYGPRTPVNIGAYSPVIGLFFKQGLKDKQPLTVVGDGKQRRDFTYVGDVVAANIKAMSKLETAPETVSGESINVGTGTNNTILEIAQKVKKILTPSVKGIKVVHIPPRQGESVETLADNSKAKELIEWSPSVSLDEGIEALRVYYIDGEFKQ